MASLGPLWRQLLRMCLHSCVPTPFLVKFGAPAPPRIKVYGTGGALVGGWENTHLAPKVRKPCGRGADSAKLLLRTPLRDESLK